MKKFIAIICSLLCVLFLDIHAQDIDSMILSNNTLEDDSLRIENFLNIAKVLRRQKPDSAISFYKKAIELSKAKGFHTITCNTYEKIALLEYSRGKFDKASEMSKAIIAYAEKSKNSKKCLRGYNLLNFFLIRLNQMEESLIVANKAIHLADSVGDSSLTGSFYNRSGAAYEALANYPQALYAYQQSQKIADARKDSNLLASTLNNIGNIMETLGQIDKQLQYYEQALEIRKLQNDPGKIAALLENIGVAHLSLKQYNVALDYFNRTLTTRKELNDQAGQSQTYINIGNAHEGLNNLNQALENYNRALRNLDGNEDVKAKCLANISDIYYKKGSFVKAEKYAQQSLAIADKLNDKELQRQTYKYLVKIYDTTSQYKKALNYYRLYSQVKDSISGIEISKQLQELETKYQSEKKAQENALLNARVTTQNLRLKQQELQQYGLISGILLMLLIALVVWRNYRQKKRANELLAQQKQEIENKNLDLETANHEITAQKNIIEEKNVKIIDSIRYARRIQETILPPQSMINRLLPDSFVLYRPKDIVSGDFYWLTETDDNKVLVSAIDCTGHGVPGAFVSIVGHNSINRVVKEFDITQPAAVLDKLNELVVKSFSKQQEHEVKDGMDMALCMLDQENMILEYAGANNPLYLVRNGELSITKADKQPIGAYENRKAFTNHRFELQKGDVIYIFSDGYIDQFGGPRGKKFMSRRFREMLLQIHNLPPMEQKEFLNKTIVEWMDKEEQIDDILVIGIRIS